MESCKPCRLPGTVGSWGVFLLQSTVAFGADYKIHVHVVGGHRLHEIADWIALRKN